MVLDVHKNCQDPENVSRSSLGREPPERHWHRKEILRSERCWSERCWEKVRTRGDLFKSQKWGPSLAGDLEP